MRTLPDRVRLRDARRKRVIELAEITHDEPVHPEPLRVRRDARERWRVYLIHEIEEAGEITAAGCHTRETARRALEGDRGLRDASLVRPAVGDETLERLEQLPNRVWLVIQMILHSPHRSVLTDR